jgi:hypothetical protein
MIQASFGEMAPGEGTVSKAARHPHPRHVAAIAVFYILGALRLFLSER